jgi:hypothetical protein
MAAGRATLEAVDAMEVASLDASSREAIVSDGGESVDRRGKMGGWIGKDERDREEKSFQTA